MVPGEDLGGAAAGVVVEDKILEEVQEIFLFADTTEHGLQLHAAGIVLLESLPFVEEFVLAAEGADFGLLAVGEHDEGIEVEEMGNGILVVGVVFGVGIPDIHIEVFQFDEEQGKAVDEAQDIRAFAVEAEFVVDLQLLDGEEVVVFGVAEVEDLDPAFLLGLAGLADGDGDAVPEEAVFLLVDLHGGGGGQMALQLFDGLLVHRLREPGVELHYRLLEVPPEHDLPIALPPEGAVCAQLLGVVGHRHFPPKLVPKHIAGTVPDEDIFRIVVAHRITLFLHQFVEQLRSDFLNTIVF